MFDNSERLLTVRCFIPVGVVVLLPDQTAFSHQKCASQTRVPLML